MTNEGTANHAVGRKVWVLAQIRGYNQKQQLATAIGFSPSLLTRKLQGTVPWTVDELERVAEVLGLTGWGDLSKPLAELVGAVGTQEEGVIESTITRYSGGSYPSYAELAQVIPLARGYQSVTSSPATPVAPVIRLDAGRRGGRAHSA
jgi:transcriptional regulator with XRE-family HTH domain